MGKRTVALLTSFNRPRLVRDCLESLLGQEDTDLRIAILDDGSARDVRNSIALACERANKPLTHYATGLSSWSGDGIHVDAYWLPPRSMAERKASISYSSSINQFCNWWLKDERYICYYCDDDFAYPEAVRARAEYLDAHPDVHVSYGRTRSIQYDISGQPNSWTGNIEPQPGVSFPRPTGPRLIRASGGPLCFFALADYVAWQGGKRQGPWVETDPQTARPFCEEGTWQPGWLRYGIDGKPDHNQLLHAVECLRSCGISWPRKPDGTVEYWPEGLEYGVGDSGFFTRLATAHRFWGVDAWVCSKKFHGLSDGVSSAEIRE